MSDDSAARRAPYIAVVGPAEADAETYALAVEVGRLIAEQGGIVLCGGLGGVMEAAARGASQAGGSSLGILPGGDRSAANPYVTVALATGLGELRNALLVRCSDAVLAVGGSWGTMSEVTLAVRLGKPVVSLRGWSVIDPGGTAPGGIIAAESPRGAVQALLSPIAAAARAGRPRAR
jgi:uncharacterized protein (TIGR00725 family)